MSAIDTQAVEAALKAQQLDQLRGYNDTYGEIKQSSETKYISEQQALGAQVLSEPMWNKGRFSTLHISPVQIA